MASPDNSLLMLAVVVLGLAVIVLAALLVRRRREEKHLREIADRLAAVAATGDVAERLAPVASGGSASEFAEKADRLLERLQHETSRRVEREQVFRRLNEAMHEGLLVDRDGIQLSNARFAELCGAESPVQLVGRKLTELVHPDFADLLGQIMQRHREGKPTHERFEVELRASGGVPLRLELSFTPITYDGHGALLVSAVEISPRPDAVAAQRAGQGAAWEALDALGEGVLTTDAQGHIVFVNKAGEQLLGKPAADVLGRTLQDVISLVEEGDRKPLVDPVRNCLANGTRVHIGRRGMLVAKDGGGDRSIEIDVSPIVDAAGGISGTVVALRDVTELRGYTRQMSYHATYDSLTGLVNKREFERRLEEALESAHAAGQRHVLCYLDLDRFKAVNDDSGHAAGDAMLREIATLFKDAVRDSDTVGRLGGDEFAILLAGCPLEKARQIADDIVRAVADYRFVWKDRIFNVGVSVGLVEVTRDSSSSEDLIGAADSACYEAKRNGGVHVYSASDEIAARQSGEIQWHRRLQLALKEGHFELHAQAIEAVDLQTQSDGPGLEVLLRLKDQGVAVAPGEFMVAAERYRLMPHVDRWVVQTALSMLANGGVRLPAGRRLCINISGQTLGDGTFMEFVVDCLDRTGVAPERLCFEVTETAVITNIDLAKRFIGVLHGMGCRFALDDFGRGLSSFSNLRKLPLDYLKIDGYFIRNLASDPVNQAMVTAMIKLARSLNFGVIAEQVEDMSALDSVRRMGVDFVQGYQVGRPQPLAAF